MGRHGATLAAYKSQPWMIAPLKHSAPLNRLLFHVPTYRVLASAVRLRAVRTLRLGEVVEQAVGFDFVAIQNQTMVHSELVKLPHSKVNMEDLNMLKLISRITVSDELESHP